MPTVLEHAHALADRTVATRRDLHAHPEIAFQGSPQNSEKIVR